MSNRRLSITKDTSLVRGVVVLNEDPERRGRIKVRIPSYHGIPNESRVWIKDEELPWCNPGVLISAGNDIGQRIIPTVGTRIFVMFEDGDLSKPVYFGGIPQLIRDTKYYNGQDASILGGNAIPITTDDSMSDFYDTEAQAAQGVLFKSLKGFTIYYNDTDGHEVVKIIDQAGQLIKMQSLDPILTRRGNKEYTSTRSNISVQSGNTKLELGEMNEVGGDGEVTFEEGLVITLPSFTLGD